MQWNKLKNSLLQKGALLSCWLLICNPLFSQVLVDSISMDLPADSRAFSVPKIPGKSDQFPEILFQTSEYAVLTSLDSNYQVSQLTKVSFGLPERGMSINGISRSEKGVFLYYQSAYSGSALRAVALSPDSDSVRRLPLKFSTPPGHYLLRSFGYQGSFFLLYFEESTSELHLYELKDGRRHSLLSSEVDLPDLENKLVLPKGERLPLLNDYLHELVELTQAPAKLYLGKSTLSLTLEYPEQQVTSLISIDLTQHEFQVRNFKVPESEELPSKKLLLNSLLVKDQLWQFSGNRQSVQLSCIDTQTGGTKLIQTYETDANLPADQTYFRKVKGLGFTEKEKASKFFMRYVRGNMALLADGADPENLRLQIGSYSGVRISLGQYIALATTAGAIASFLVYSGRDNVQTLGYEPYLMIGGLTYGLTSLLVRQHHYRYTYQYLQWDGTSLSGASAAPNRYLRFKEFVGNQKKRNQYTASLALYIQNELFYGYVYKGKFWLYRI